MITITMTNKNDSLHVQQDTQDQDKHIKTPA